MDRWRWLSCASVLGCAAAQIVAPELIVLNRIKNHMRDDLAQVRNYTCVESVRRFYKALPHGKLLPFDSLFLEIVYTGAHEWYGLPGDRTLSEHNPVSFTGSGMIGDGLFAITLHNLFVADIAIFTPKGEDTINGRKTVRYDFRLPRSVNRLDITLPFGAGRVGEEGTFWVDPDTLDLLRLEGHAIEIPEYLPLAALEFTISYSRMRIGELDAVLAQQAELHMADTFGNEGFDRFDFTHCRTYHTVSTIHFGEGPEAAIAPGAPAPPPSPDPGIKIPSLLAVTIATVTPITDQDPVGKRIEGRVMGDVKHKGKVLIDDGAPVQGRVRRLERYSDKASFVVGLEFTDVQTNNGPARFYADLLSLDKRKDIRASLEERVLAPSGRRPIEVYLKELPGVASFFVDGKTFTIPAGFRSVWRTRGLLRGAQ